ncbi:MAG: hypothetical protein JSV16_03695 [Candidatus Hydrogenedentota bacterium]|nr:MAG: hypothetical protein JSV16_03695 [Candidatus Hydrogenedentota bacterium]
MGEAGFRRLRDWVEPAHPAVVRLHDDLLAIYTRIRERYQAEIDQTFDRISRDIGFVVTSTLPVALEISDNGKIKSIRVGAEHLKGTVFEREFAPIFKSIPRGDAIPAQAGAYAIRLIWYDALKLRIRTDWMEPAHFRDIVTARFRPWGARPWVEPAHLVPDVREPAHVPPEVMEPAHWFDPGAAHWREKVLISVIDEVYPELHLADRIVSVREKLHRWVRPEVKEPAHFRDITRRLSPEVLEELAEVMKRHGY